MVIHETKGDKVFDAVNVAILVIVLLFCAYPIWFVLCASISDPDMVNSGKMLIWPKKVTTLGYTALFSQSKILIGYRNTIFYTVAGTLVNLIATLPAAYALSRKDFVGGKAFTIFFMFTMFFNGGLMPTYMVISQMHMVNTIWVMILPGAAGMFNIILCRTFFVNSIPLEMQEAAQIDGCSNFKLFMRIVLPLSKPIIAVMVLFCAIGHWNSFFTALVYITNEQLKPLQLVLNDILIQSAEMQDMIQKGLIEASDMQASVQLQQLIQYSLIVTASLPVMCLYPLVQKYFVKGVMVGAIKS